MSRIAIIQGHPAPGGGRFCHALAQAYATGAAEGGHDIRHVDVAELDFPMLRSKSDWEDAAPPAAIAGAQATIAWAEHLVIVYPLWLGGMPALLKGFLEQVLRPNFLAGTSEPGASWKTTLKGRSSRTIVTMGMPAFVYRWYFGAHSLRSLKRSILGLVGVGPNRHMLIGSVETMSVGKRKAHLDAVRRLGSRAV
ncbi:NAD(P)H-dependent oxidoreductase [Microvirga subterranea]|uniref:Putative NADPH-quinone reductase n=1 Tax=Microvirga subterranea TaxID=186651 RepID=A0A370HS56_9HYPH|nr:NAD(P)H-dependent oxidoreductase [Microvirga subterranea]RDI61130.1 putative NADPH-quinone reductase [Microvirga subterranea]